jgi:metal-sulfur cluster biosynthetic enzyme
MLNGKKIFKEELITVNTDPNDPFVDVRFTPTIPHCSMAALIGLSIYTKLKRFFNDSDLMEVKNLETPAGL